MAEKPFQIVSADDTDFLPESERCLGYLIDLEMLEAEAHSIRYITSVEEKLMDGFARLARSSKKKLSNADFPVYVGDYFGGGKPYFIVGISTRVLGKVTDLMTEELSKVPGYETLETVDSDLVNIIPWMRYEKGRVIHYKEYDLRGRSFVDERTGLTVVNRYVSLLPHV